MEEEQVWAAEAGGAPPKARGPEALRGVLAAV